MLTNMVSASSMSIPNYPFIFVSYSNKDASFVHSEIRRFERQGYLVWYDKGELQPARFWAEEISKAIAACACFIVFITEDSSVSEHVCDEINQALSANKPFIAVYWDKVELPAGLQKVVRTRQQLDRHSMHQSAYEEPLSKALSEHIPRTIASTRKADTLPVLSLPPVPTLDPLPNLLFFGLVLCSSISFFLAVVVVITPHIISTKSPNDLLNNQVVGLMGAIMLVIVGLALGGAAFAVFRVYLRRNND